MKRHAPSVEDTADILHHRATVPGLVWAGLLLAVCFVSWFGPPEPNPEPKIAANTHAVPASSAQGTGVHGAASTAPADASSAGAVAGRKQGTRLDGF